MRTNYTVEDIISFIQIVNCMSYDKFFEMYKEVFDYVSDYYVKEKYESAMNNVSNWMCFIDYQNLEKMMNFCLNK